MVDGFFVASQTESKFDFNNVIKVTFSFHSSEKPSTIWSEQHSPTFETNARQNFSLDYLFKFVMELNWEIRNKNGKSTALYLSSSSSRSAVYPLKWGIEYGLLAYDVSIQLELMKNIHSAPWFISVKRFMRNIRTFSNSLFDHLLPLISDSFPFLSNLHAAFHVTIDFNHYNRK